MEIQENTSLKPYTNYKIGGNARYFIEAKAQKDILEAFDWANKKDINVFVLGYGTNIIVSDDGYKGLVLFMNNSEYDIKGEKIVAQAGVELDKLVKESTKMGLKGLEWAGGLPGSVGGAVYGNVGAFEGEIKDVLLSVIAKDPENKIVTMSQSECEMNYRESIFKKQDGWIILSAEFQFKKGDSEQLTQKAEDLREWRRTKHPIEYGNCGSVFKRIPVESIDKKIFDSHPDITGAVREGKVAIAYFIDQCGLKKYRIGGIEVSEKHPNFLVNIDGNGRAEDFIILVSIIKHKVLERFGVFLEEEIEYIGFSE